MKSDEKKFWEAWGQVNALYSRWADLQKVNYYLQFVLYALDAKEDMTQKDICNCTGLTKQTVNSIIRILKNQEYLVLLPSSEDKREKRVVMTEKGIAYAQELLAPLHELEQTVFSLIGKDRIQQMIDSITLFHTVFQEELEKKQK